MNTTNDMNRDDRAIRALLDQMADAWRRADPDAYAGAFTEDCRYIAFFGGIYRGRAELAESHRLLWASALRGTELFSEVLEIRFLTPDVAVIVTRGDVAKKRPRKLEKVQSYVAVRRDERWLFAHFQNTKRDGFIEFMTYRAGPGAIPSLDRERPRG